MAPQMEQQVSPPARVQAALIAAGVDARIEEFPSSTRTAQEAAATVGTSVGQIVKSLLFLAGDSPVLALVSASWHCRERRSSTPRSRSRRTTGESPVSGRGHLDAASRSPRLRSGRAS